MSKQGKQNMQFDAEIGKVLRMMIHSVYTNKDIFLRELISNAADAIEKRRYQALTNSELAIQECGQINIIIDTKNGSIAVRDNGIGMSSEDLVNNLGTIAKSGTEEFVKSITKNNNDVSLIGQFGVGFYSVFMVAEHVEVTTRKAATDNVFLWQSNGESGYTIEELKIHQTFDFGTEVKVFINDENKARYIDQYAIEFIAKSYSSNLNVPINLVVDDKVSAISNNGAIWHRDKKSITDEEYKDFYKMISHLPDKPAITMHYKIEGNVEFAALLFVPSTKPFDLFHPDRSTRVKLYVRKVFINESIIDIIPKYLRFVQGVIDANDLPLNISRESLQDSALLDKIRDIVVKKIINELKQKSNDDINEYEKIWTNFGEVIKEGLCEPQNNREDLLEICRFYSTYNDGSSLISLAEYVSRMPEKQKDIFFCSGASIHEILHEAQLEAFKKANIEVLLFYNTVDSFWTNVIHDYKGKNLVSISRNDVDINMLTNVKEAEEVKIDSEKIEEKELIASFSEALEDRVKKVTISHKLIESPACLAIDTGSMDIKMERFLMEQNQIRESSKKILEINPNSDLVKQAFQKLQNTDSKDEGISIAVLIFEIACIAQNEPIKFPGSFAKRVVSFLEKSI